MVEKRSPNGTSLARSEQVGKYKHLHSASLVCDLHCDTLTKVLEGYQLKELHTDNHIDLPRLKAGGVDVQVFACFVDPRKRSEGYAKHAEDLIHAMYDQIQKNPTDMSLARKAGDLERLHVEGKLAAVLSIEGGHIFEDDLSRLEVFYDLGVRSITLTWQNSNGWGDAAADQEPKHGGLTPLGQQAVRMMNGLGMIVDVSHVAEATFWDAVDVCEAPLIASHSCVWALNNHYRNLKDDQIKALAQKQGLFAVNFYPSFLEADPAQQHHLPLSRLIEHIDYAVNLVGPDYVGLGSDFDGISRTPLELSDVSKLPLITKALLEKGYAPQDIEKILGRSFLRVFNAVCLQ